MLETHPRNAPGQDGFYIIWLIDFVILWDCHILVNMSYCYKYGGGFTENDAEFMVFMDLDSPEICFSYAKRYVLTWSISPEILVFLYVQRYVLTWSISGMCFQYNLAL